MNLVRMNLYRFMKTKSAYVILIIATILTGFLTLDMTSEEGQAMNQELLQQEGIDAEQTAGIAIGLTILTSASEMTGELVGSGMILVLVAIFAAIFSNTERAGGYLKNLNSCAGAKAEVFLAKIVPVMLFTFVILWIVPFVSVVCGLEGNGIWTKEFLLYMVAQWLIHTAFSIFILMIMEITRSLLAGILVGIFAGMGFGITLIQMIENAIHGQGIISGHMLVTVARMLMPENIVNLLFPALVTGVIGVMMYSVIGAVTFQKRDIY